MLIIYMLKIPGPKMVWGLPRGDGESQSDAVDEDGVAVTTGLEAEWS